jgi:hypothetical protein
MWVVSAFFLLADLGNSCTQAKLPCLYDAAKSTDVATKGSSMTRFRSTAKGKVDCCHAALKFQDSVFITLFSRRGRLYVSAHQLGDMLSHVLNVPVVGHIGDVQPQISKHGVDRKAAGILW